MQASVGGHENIVELLLSCARLDVNVINQSGRNAFSHAFQGGHEAVLRRLLQAGSKVDMQELSTPGSLARVGHEKRELMLHHPCDSYP